MAAASQTENADPIFQLKLETASIVENIVKNFDVKISTARDFRILTDSIFQREAIIRHFQNIIASKPKLVCQEQQTSSQDEHVQQELHDDPQKPEPVKNIDTVSTQTDHKKDAIENDLATFEEEQPNPDVLCHLTQLVADIGQDRDDLLVYVSKLEQNQQTMLSKLHLLQKQNAALVHQNNLRHLASTMHAGNEEYCTLSGAPEETLHKSPLTASMKVPDSSIKDPEEIKTSEPAFMMPSSAELPRRLDDTNQISRMLDSVDRIARVYSPPHRYHKPNHVNLSKSRYDVTPDKLFNFEFAALWMYASDATAEEEAAYDLHLQKEARPPPVHSPTLQQPCVDWTSLNPSQYRNLPTPEEFSVRGCSQDPTFYTDTELDVYSSYNKRVLSWEKKRHPFGALFGFQTNLGVVAVPHQPLFGYRCCPVSGTWMIDATPRCPPSSATSSRRSGGSRGGGRREETATSVYT